MEQKPNEVEDQMIEETIDSKAPAENEQKEEPKGKDVVSNRKC